MTPRRVVEKVASGLADRSYPKKMQVGSLLISASTSLRYSVGSKSSSADHSQAGPDDASGPCLRLRSRRSIGGLRDVDRLDGLLAEEYVLDVEDHFDGQELNGSLWAPFYLPQWSSAARSAARYELADSCLHLLIEADQGPWCPEFDGETWVPSLQTGVSSGPVGSPIG